jgi:hypothetical protein
MKKLILAIILMGGAYQLKAQQLFNVKPADTALTNLQKSIQVQIDKQLNAGSGFYNPKIDQVIAINSTKEIFYQKIPVAVLEGHDNMPVAKPQGASKMPVLLINPVDTTVSVKPFKDPQFFYTPAKLYPFPQN